MNFKSQRDIDSANKILRTIFNKSVQRGRDGRGYGVTTAYASAVVRAGEKDTSRVEAFRPYMDFFLFGATHGNLIGNMRAEPTTEFVKDKRDEDQQPYTLRDWSIVHNGTIANDAELRTREVPTDIDSAAILETLDYYTKEGFDPEGAFMGAIHDIKGSWAILASNLKQPGKLYVAANYRPVWYAKTDEGVYFASSRNYFPAWMTPQMLEPYSAAVFDATGIVDMLEWQSEGLRKALVVCSGGLDSVVSACAAKEDGYKIELLHFQYGSRAEGPEVKAVKDVAEALGVPLRLFPIPIYKPEDSPLLRADSEIAGGEAGAEFAHEWVPARNLVMLSVATALAEAGGFETIVLGNNLEEAGAYPDNEPEFIARFNDVLPFAVGDGKRVRVKMPVGNLMKHEIVALGHKLGAPMDKTWSCYRAGELHCGTCGPCFMRRKAFEINNLPEVIRYSAEEV